MFDEPPPGAVATGDSFERLIEQVRRVHDLEVLELRRELQRFRDKLASEGSQQVESLADQPSRFAAEAGMTKWPREEDTMDYVIQSPEPESADPDQDRLPRMSKDSPGSRTKGMRRGLTGSLHHQQLQNSQDNQEAASELLSRIVHHWAFEMAVAGIIIANGLAIAAEAQYQGILLAKTTGHPSAGGIPTYASWDMPVVFDVLNWFFGILCVVELLVRVGAAPVSYLKGVWSWFDVFIVVLWILGEATTLFFGAHILRLARLARLMRLVRLVKHMKSAHFDSLYLMATALTGSLSVLMWSFCLMFLVHLVIALAINQCLRELYFSTDPAKAADQVEVFEYFGSFSRAFMTMFEISLANWPIPCRILVEQVSEWFVVYAIVHKMTLGFAAIGIINAIFVQETFKVASADNHVMVKQSMHKQRLHREKMARLFEEADEDGDGSVSLQEWQQICKDDWVKAWLASQEVNVSDAEKLFIQLDNGDGILTSDELIQGTARLKGPAQAMYVMETVGGMYSFLRQFKDELFAQRPVMSERCRADID